VALRGFANVVIASGAADVPLMESLLFFFAFEPPTAPPTTAPITNKMMTAIVIIPLRLFQNEGAGVGAGDTEVDFSLWPASISVAE